MAGMRLFCVVAFAQSDSSPSDVKPPANNYFTFVPPDPQNPPPSSPTTSEPEQRILSERFDTDTTARHRWSPHGLHLITRIPKNISPPNQVAQACGRGDWIVYGFHPSWASSSAYKSYQFDLLTHVAFFGYQVNVKTGGPMKPGDLGNWSTTPLIDSAHAAGCKVHLTVETVLTNGSSYSMLTNPTVAAACIDSICYYVRMRKADGVCVDFEDMYSESDAIPFLNWMTSLAAALKKDNPAAELTMAGPALPSTSTFTQAALYQVIDYNVIMGYGYAGNYSGSPNPGCNTPLPPPSGSSGINMVSTVQTYVSKGVPAKQLVMALPYYGGAWLTADSTSTTPPGTYQSTPTFSSVCGNYPGNGYISHWDSKSGSSYFVKPQDASYLQAWVLDSLSMALRYDTIKAMGLAGTGMWALSYDAGSTQLWDLLNVKFGSCTEAALPSISLDPHWMTTWRWTLPVGCLIALLVLVVILVFSRKARNEILNRYWLFPLGTFLLMVAVIIIYDAVRDPLHHFSAGFPWFICLGTVILIIGFFVGQWWNERKHR